MNHEHDRMTTIGPPSDSVIETEVGGDVSLYDPSSERVVVLNATASDIWRLCDGEQTLDEIVEMLARAYSVRADDIRPQVEETIATLVDGGLLSA